MRILLCCCEIRYIPCLSKKVVVCRIIKSLVLFYNTTQAGKVHLLYRAVLLTRSFQLPLHLKVAVIARDGVHPYNT